jgi:hypothetical protein
MWSFGFGRCGAAYAVMGYEHDTSDRVGIRVGFRLVGLNRRVCVINPDGYDTVVRQRRREVRWL